VRGLIWLCRKQKQIRDELLKLFIFSCLRSFGLVNRKVSINCLIVSLNPRIHIKLDTLLLHAFLHRIFCGKTLLLTSSGARVQESKSSIAYIFRSKKQEPEQEWEWRNPVPFKENYSPPRTYYSLIGCSPGEGRAHGVENYPWHMRRLFVYHLEHRMSAPSCNGECEGGFPHRTSGWSS
jgi:hypothetical protein